MSTIYLNEDRVGMRSTLLSTLSDEDWEVLETNYAFLERSIITPILSSKEKKLEVTRRLNDFSSFFSNANQYLSRKYPHIFTEERLAKLYDSIRGTQLSIPERYRIAVSEALDLLQENDYYLLNYAENPALQRTLLSMGLKSYLRAYHGTLLCLILINYESRWGKPFSPSILLMMKRYMEELEPFVVTLQVELEPDLAYLKDKHPPAE